MAPIRAPIGSSLQRRSRAWVTSRSKTSRPSKTFASWPPAQPRPGRAPAAASRGRVEGAALEVALDCSDRRLDRVAAPADQREIAAGAEEFPRRLGDAPGGGDRRHLEVVAQDEAVEAETAAQQARD